MGGRQVLELVDEHVPVLALDPAPEGAVAQQRLHAAVDLLVEVDRAPRAQRLAVGLETVGQARHVVAGVLDLGGVLEPEAGDREAVQVGTDRIGVRHPPPRDREDLLDHPARVRLAEHPRAVAAVAGEQRVPERVERARPRRERLQARLELVLGELVVGDSDHLLAPVAAVGEQVAHPLGEHARLPRAGGGDHPYRAAVVGDRGELVGREGRGRRRRILRHRVEESGLHGLCVDDDLVEPRDAPARAAVDPGVAAVLDDHVRRAALVGAGAHGLRRPPPDRLPLPGVVVVRPDQVMETVMGQVEPRRQRVGPLLDRSGLSEVGRVGRQRDDDRLAAAPVPVQPLDGGLGGGQRARVDLHPGRGLPGGGRRGARGDDHAAPEGARGLLVSPQRRGSRPVSSR